MLASRRATDEPRRDTKPYSSGEDRGGLPAVPDWARLSAMPGKRIRRLGPLRAAGRLGRALWRWRQLLPLTPLGALVIGTALAVHSVWAASTLDFVLHAAALVALGLVSFSVLLVLVVSALLWLRLRRGPLEAASEIELESGVRAATGFTFPRFGAWPLVQLRLEWTDPPRVAVRSERRGGRAEEVVEPAERGHTPVLWRRLVVVDIFGLARLGLPRRSPRSVRVVPSRARLTGHVITHFVGGDALSYPTGPADGELLDMRRYVHGLSLIHI